MAELPIGWLGPRGGIPVATRFLRFMASNLKGGTLTVVDADGTHRFGDGSPEATMVIHDPSVYWSTLRQGSVGLGRDYADGLWDCDDLTTLTRVLSRGLRPVTALQDTVGQAVGASTDWLRRIRPPSKHVDRDNIQAHYDVSNDFFALMLDETMMYSSAMFARPDMSLADAQRVKLDRLCNKLGLGPDDHVVEIGTGWGGFACHAAARYGCRGDYDDHLRRPVRVRLEARRRRRAGSPGHRPQRGLPGPAGTFDKLVSIEMIEAVDWRQHDTFFRTCAGLLHEQGLMALQAITLEDRSFERAKNGTDFVGSTSSQAGAFPPWRRSPARSDGLPRWSSSMSRTSAGTTPRHCADGTPTCEARRTDDGPRP